MSADDVPFGYVQTYHVADYPDYWRALALEGDVFGVDLFVGEKDYLHRGYGSAALRRFVREVVFGQLDAELCVVGPVPENAAAIRAYEKAGFRYLKTISTGHEREERLMVAYPEDVTHNEE
jgi:RimJ/RimL family protein N-acetyltransferase